MSITYNPSIVTDGLVLCLDANNKKSYPGTGASWKDLSLNKNDCTLFSATPFNTTGNINSIVMDGTGTGYATALVPQIQSSAVITVEGFMKWNALVTGMFFGFTTYDVWTHTGGLGFNNGAGNVIGISASQVIALGLIGTYNHYAFVMNSSGILSTNKIFINGNLQTNATQIGADSSIPGFNTTLVLSGWTNDTNYRNNINYGNFRIYNRELSISEISKNFNAHKGLYIGL